MDERLLVATREAHRLRELLVDRGERRVLSAEALALQDQRAPQVPAGGLVVATSQRRAAAVLEQRGAQVEGALTEADRRRLRQAGPKGVLAGLRAGAPVTYTRWTAASARVTR